MTPRLDEFLLLLPRSDREDTRRRREGFNPLSSRAWEGPPPPPQSSWGIETFDSPQGLSKALEGADRARYEAKTKPSPQSVG
jgi:GGDEF domain-containing protein